MQFADLMILFREGQNEGRKRGYVSQGACDAEGIAAVVRALRDEFGRIMYPGDDWNRQCILEQFDQILGDAGNEKVAGNQWTASTQPQLWARTPATAPAPAVCEWTPLTFCWSTSCGRRPHNTPFAGYPNCACGLPIKFTEAK